MREILFRGKSSLGEWVYGDLTTDKEESNKAYIWHFVKVKPDWNGYVPSESFTEVDPETVCECTGLEDKNGRKIFENDIIECRRKDKHFQSQIEWDSTCAGFMFQDSKEGSMVGLDALLDGGIYSDFEVIGNIFGNLELVEKNA